MIVVHDSIRVDLTTFTSVVFSCKQLETLTFTSDIPALVKKQVFRGLKDNPTIKHVVIDEWQDLDDDMFKELMKSLQINTI